MFAPDVDALAKVNDVMEDAEMLLFGILTGWMTINLKMWINALPKTVKVFSEQPKVGLYCFHVNGSCQRSL